MKELRIKEFIKYVGENSKKHGFREREIPAAEFIALIHITLKMENRRAFHQN